jgi:hypothetical protein
MPEKILLWVDMPFGCMGTFPEKEGGVHVLASLAQSIQGVGSLIRASLAAQLTGKMIVLILISIYLKHLFLIRTIYKPDCDLVPMVKCKI